MKTRLGFVSNSSSSSFILSKNKVTKKQLDKIRNHKDVVRTIKFKLLRKLDKEYECSYDELDPSYSDWKIREDEEYIFGNTSLDNFDMCKFLRLVGVDIHEVSFYEYETCDSIVSYHKKRINK